MRGETGRLAVVSEQQEEKAVRDRPRVQKWRQTGKLGKWLEGYWPGGKRSCFVLIRASPQLDLQKVCHPVPVSVTQRQARPQLDNLLNIGFGNHLFPWRSRVAGYAPSGISTSALYALCFRFMLLLGDRAYCTRRSFKSMHCLLAGLFPGPSK